MHIYHIFVGLYFRNYAVLRPTTVECTLILQ